MSHMERIAKNIIAICASSVGTGSPEPITIKTVKTRTKESSLVCTATVGGQITINSLHGGAYGKSSFTSMMPMGDDDVPDLAQFLTMFVNEHKEFASSKK